nr:hypothetical protein [Paracoccus saliphilus]
MRNFVFGLAAGVVVSVGGFWAYFTTGEKLQQFTEMRCWIAISMPYGSPAGAPDPVAGATDLVGPDKADRAVDLCRLILE